MTPRADSDHDESDTICIPPPLPDSIIHPTELIEQRAGQSDAVVITSYDYHGNGRARGPAALANPHDIKVSQRNLRS